MVALEWTENGVTICNALYEQDFPVIISDDNRGAIVAWEDVRWGNWEIFAQKINSEGTAYWMENGVPIFGTPSIDQRYPRICYNGNGGALVVCTQYAGSGSYVCVGEINSNGIGDLHRIYGGPLEISQEFPEICSNGAGYPIITWVEDNFTIIVLYTGYGDTISTSGYSPKIISDENGGAIITWIDNRNGTSDIYSQKINSEGIQWTENGVAVCTSVNNQSTPVLTGDNNGGAIITWSDYRSEQSYDIYASRINKDGLLPVSAPHFTKIWSGNPYHPMNIYVTSAKLDGVDLEADNEIAVFDGDICVASAVLNLPIPSGSYLQLIASTDDPTTTEVDGFVEGDTIIFKFWDSGNSREINRISANYTQGNAKFEVQGTVQVNLDGITTITQDIELSTGWNIFSFMIEPSNTNLQQILNPLIDSDVLVKVQDETGNAIEQLTDIGWINNIGNWVSTEGYYLKSNNTATLTLTDPPVQLPISIPLTNSWNIISYPVKAEQDAMPVLNDLITAGQLVKVQDENGNAIEHLPEPVGWVNFIGNFKGDEGYYLKANAITSLTLNEPLPSSPITKKINKAKQNKSILKIAANHFVPVYSGNAYLAMNIYVTSMSLSGGGSFKANDEIGIFDGDVCVGAYVLSEPIDHLISTIASTDDPTTTEIDGFIPGHEISYKFWLSSESKEIIDYLAVYSTGSGIFSSQGTVVLSFTNVLPIELVSFKAEPINNHIILNWETATEIKNFGFEVQRMASYKQSEIVSQDKLQTSNQKLTWEKIGFVKGNGNSNSLKNYQFIDKRLFGGNKFSYRLKQIDIDGNFIYSEEIEVEAMPDEYYLSQNYPNPFNPVTNIEFQIVNPGLVTLKVYDILGNEAGSILNKEFETGYYKFQWDGSRLASGVYFYQLKTGDFIQTKKMILLK